MMLRYFPQGELDESYWDGMLSDFNEYVRMHDGSPVKEYVAKYASFCVSVLQWAATGKESAPREVEYMRLPRGDILELIGRSDFEMIEFLWGDRRTVLKVSE